MAPARENLPPAARRARRLARACFALVGLTVALMVLGALVRAHGAGLACPDWPLCFGEVVPRMDLEVGFEWTHRVAAGSLALLFALLLVAALRDPGPRRAAGGLLAAAAALLAAQILLGALTVWLQLAVWTVTAHLLTASAFTVTLLLAALRLSELAGPPPARPPVAPAARALLVAAAALLALELLLGGLLSASYAGLACPEWPTCFGGRWFPSLRGTTGLHLAHRLNGYAVLALLLASAVGLARCARAAPFAWLAVGLATAQVGVGVANVLLRLPVEVTALHTALAAALVLAVARTLREAVGEPRLALLHRAAGDETCAPTRSLRA